MVEVQVQATCTNVRSAWSPSSFVHVVQPPNFRRLSGDGDEANTCWFREGNQWAGIAGLACRIRGRGHESVSATPVLTLSGDDKDLFELVVDDARGCDSAEFRQRVQDYADEHGTSFYQANALARDIVDCRLLDATGGNDSHHTLRFKSPADFENPTHPDGIYRVTLTLTDPEYNVANAQEWTIRVRDIDEVETWTLDSLTPRVGQAMVARVTHAAIPAGGNGDNPLDLDFLWESSDDEEPRQWQRIPDSEMDTYTPRSDTLGKILRFTVRYTDAGGAQEWVSDPTSPVAGNQRPTFNSGNLTRSMYENALPGTPVGDPITASDPGDVLTYSISDPDSAAFTIDATTGQLRTVANVNYDRETKARYTFAITATDGNNGTSAPATVIVMLDDEPEDGDIDGLSTAPRVGQELMPTLTDAAGAVANERWQWQESAAGIAWTDLPAGSYQNYVPQAAQISRRLRVTVTYDTGDVNRRQYAEQVVPGSVVAAAGGTITAQSQLSFTLAENRSGGTPVRLGPLGIRSSGITSGELNRTIDVGDDAKFTLAEDVLQYIGMGEDYEALSEPQEYRLRIKAVHSGVVAYSEVTVTITNVDEPGVVTIAEPPTLRPGLPLTATLTDGDGPEAVQWQWQERLDGETGWRSIAGATYPEFVPWLAQSLLPNNRLRVVVRYADALSGAMRHEVTSDPTGVLQAAAATTLRVNQPVLRIHLPERVSTYNGQRERTRLHSFDPYLRTEHCVDDNPCTTSRTALPPDADTSFRITDGNASRRFDIDNDGALYYVGWGEDYEALADASEPPYRLRVEVAHGDDERFHSVVSVYVVNEDDPGMMSVTTPDNLTVGATVTASIADPDGPPSNVQWAWGRVASTAPMNCPDPTDVNVDIEFIDGAPNAGRYTTVAGDQNHCVVAVATYNDPQGSATRRVAGHTARPVMEDGGGPGTNTPPEFTPANPRPIPETDPHAPASAHYIASPGLPENRSGTGTGIPIETVHATDSDTVRYSLPDSTPSGFAINADTGVLTYAGPGVDFEQRSSYLLTVFASDGETSSSANVFVPVVDVDEPEEVVLTMTDSAGQALTAPEAGMPIVASLQGGDGVHRRGGALTWQWQQGANGARNGWTDIPAATAPRYTPTEENEGEYLRVAVNYYDVLHFKTDPTTPQIEYGVTAAPVHVLRPLAPTALSTTSSPIHPDGYIEGEEITLAVRFNAPVRLNGTLDATLEFDAGATGVATRTDDGTAAFTDALELTYTVQLGDVAATGFTVAATGLSLSGGGTIRDGRERDVARLSIPTYEAPHRVAALVTDFPDVNHDGAITAADGLVMYYEARVPLRTAPSRRVFLAPFLATGVPHNDASYQQLLRSANLLRTHGGTSALDVNGDGAVTWLDATAIYYALQFPELVGGDGQAGFDHYRRQLIDPYTRGTQTAAELVTRVRALATP